MSIARKIIKEHLVSGKIKPDNEIGLHIDQTLTQDATGTLVMLELEAMDLDRVRTELSVQYVDHNILQTDERNADDHLMLKSAAEKFGFLFSPPGTGVSHPLHQMCFAVPGKTLLGSDSHTPASGAVGMLAIGSGGIDIASAIAGQPYVLNMPRIVGIEVTGELLDWVSAKDVILELLRRHDVSWAKGAVLEYYGDGLKALDVDDRHVICNMGTELGATSSIFPSDNVTRDYYARHNRSQDWLNFQPDNTDYDESESIDLSVLLPLIAKPGSPDDVVPVEELSGKPVYQCYIGSSANPGFKDLAIVAELVENHRVSAQVSLDINPSNRVTFQQLIETGYLSKLSKAGARIHQLGCNGCIGMGQAPAPGKISLRTVPRNFRGRSGTPDDEVYLVSPQTAAAAAITGQITDPRSIAGPYPRIKKPASLKRHPQETAGIVAPKWNPHTKLHRGKYVKPLPSLKPVDFFSGPILLKVGDNISTDDILPAGAKILPLRSDIVGISQYCFHYLSTDYVMKTKDGTDHLILAGENYGQGSSREHAALAPRIRGLRVVLALSFARIHRRNLISFGVTPIEIEKETYDELQKGARVNIKSLMSAIENKETIIEIDDDRGQRFIGALKLSDSERSILKLGSRLEAIRGSLAI